MDKTKDCKHEWVYHRAGTIDGAVLGENRVCTICKFRRMRNVCGCYRTHKEYMEQSEGVGDSEHACVWDANYYWDNMPVAEEYPDMYIENMVDRKRFAIIAKRVRKSIGCSQEELGKRLKISHATISRYESGHAVPKADTLLWYLDQVGRLVVITERCRECGGSGTIDVVQLRQGIID